VEEKKPALFWRGLKNFEDISVAVLYILMTIVIFWQIIARFVLQSSLPWSEELARYLMAWAVFIGASIAAADGAHIGITALVDRFSRKTSHNVRLVAVIFSLIFAILMVYLGIIIIGFLIKTGQQSPSMRIPMYIPYGSVAFGGLLMTIRFGRRAYEMIVNPPKDDNQEGVV